MFLPQTLIFSSLYLKNLNFVDYLIFHTVNSDKTSSVSLKYQRFTQSGCTDLGIKKILFVAQTQFHYIFLQFAGLSNGLKNICSHGTTFTKKKLLPKTVKILLILVEFVEFVCLPLVPYL